MLKGKELYFDLLGCEISRYIGEQRFSEEPYVAIFTVQCRIGWALRRPQEGGYSHPQKEWMNEVWLALRGTGNRIATIYFSRANLQFVSSREAQ
jgi:hypothetical protein